MTLPTVQIGDEIREMTEKEHGEWLAHLDELAQRQAEIDAKAAAKKAVLAKLGLTADEAAALLG